MDVSSLGRHDSWADVRAVVAGLGASGLAVVDNLLFLRASVTGVGAGLRERDQQRAELLEALGADLRVGALPDDSAEAAYDDLLRGADVLVTSPGYRPDSPLLRAARERGVPVWGEVELAWRLRDTGADGRGAAAPWLAVTGTNGKTTTVQMLDAILRAAGLRSVAAGNVGLPLVEAVMDPEPYDVLAVELSSFQLHYTETMQAESAAVLNVAEDHLDWYDGPTAMADYAADKGRIYRQVSQACVYNEADPETERLVREADVVDGARAVGFTLGMPSVGQVGLVEDILVDRAFIAERHTSAAELCTLADLAGPGGAEPPLHVVANALAAAALARAHGVSQQAVRDGLRSFRPDGHRIAEVGVVDGVRFVDDSKATNPHAARSSLRSFDPVVWVAGGLAKGARFDDLVRDVGPRLRGAVLLGRDRQVVAEALSRHAPDVPVIEIGDGETGDPMDRVVDAAARLARPGDTVLLAPGCASMDMFADYGARGDAFVAAVRRRQQRS